MKKQIIKNDFLFKNTKKSVRLKFLNKVSKSLVYVSKATGLAYHPNFIQSEKIAGTWEKMYKKKNIPQIFQVCNPDIITILIF